VKKASGAPSLDHDAVIHQDRAVSHLARKSNLVRDTRHRHSGFGQRFHRVETSPTSSGSSAKWARSNSMDLGVHGQCASDRDPLLLAT